MLSGGNFAFALATGDCIFIDNGYITCEMECCKENPCIEDEDHGKVVIKDDSKSCCEVHVEKSMERDITLPVIVKKIQISKLFLVNLHSINIINESSAFVPVIHKFKTTNILLFTSILRI